MMANEEEIDWLEIMVREASGLNEFKDTLLLYAKLTRKGYLKDIPTGWLKKDVDRCIAEGYISEDGWITDAAWKAYFGSQPRREEAD